MTEEIIIDGVNVKDCERRIGKNNFCRYFKRNCADNNYNCIWKKCLRLEQENERLRGTDGNIHPDSAYYKIKKLEIENEELKQANKKMYQSMHEEICEYDEELGIEKASHESDLEILDKYRSALEEIRNLCNKGAGVYTNAKVVGLINEVLNN